MKQKKIRMNCSPSSESASLLILHPQRAQMCRLRFCTLNCTSHNKDQDKTSVSINSVARFDCLFVHSIYIPLSSTPLFPQTNRWLHKVVSGFALDHVFALTNIVTVFVVSWPRWQKAQAQMCLHHGCLSWRSYRKLHIWDSCTLFSGQCLSVHIILPTYKVHISLKQCLKQWGVALNSSCCTVHPNTSLGQLQKKRC